MNLSGSIDPQSACFQEITVYRVIAMAINNYQGCLGSHGKHDELQVRDPNVSIQPVEYRAAPIGWA